MLRKKSNMTPILNGIKEMVFEWNARNTNEIKKLHKFTDRVVIRQNKTTTFSPRHRLFSFL